MRRLFILFPPSELTLTLNRSRDFQLLVIVLHVSALIALWLAHWSVPLVLALSVMLLVMMVEMVMQGSPHAEFKQLVCRNSCWFTYHKNGTILSFTNARICYDVGLFMRIELFNKTQRLGLILFADQFSLSSRRVLNLMCISQSI